MAGRAAGHWRRSLYRSCLRAAAAALLAVGGIGTALAQTSTAAGAQVPTTPRNSAASSTATILGTSLIGDSAAYRVEWNGTTGTLIRKANGALGEIRTPLIYLHGDPGPKGYAQHLAWFLARNGDSFSILWCYVNDSGHDFFAYLYRYPMNQMTILRLTGDYRFTPPKEPVPENIDRFLTTQQTPHYMGPDFIFRDWTRRRGSLAKLDLHATLPEIAQNTAQTSSQAGTPAASPASDQTVKTLTDLRVYPLHQVRVGTANGWRTTGWRELHTLAYDGNNDPYYLIQYSNVSSGYVVDLRRAQTYHTDFGASVQFSSDDSAFGGPDETTGGNTDIQEQRAPRNTRFEVTLASAQTHANPFTEVQLDADIIAPDGTKVTVPGFWDGGSVWRFRFVPTQIGDYRWSTRSNDLDLHKQQGQFVCTRDTTAAKGFLQVQTGSGYQRHFSYADGTPFLPVFIYDPLHYIVTESVLKASAPAFSLHRSRPSLCEDSAVQASPAIAPDQAGVKADTKVPLTFLAFQQRVDVCAAKGYNRFVGSYLLQTDKNGLVTRRNEGGMMFLNNDPDQPNPAYFQWMDRRIDYCNAKGIVPDLGIGTLDSTLTAALTDAEIRGLWRYVLARTAASDVCWNLFDAPAPGTPVDPTSGERIVALAQSTRRYDPYNHPLSITLKPVFATGKRAPIASLPGASPGAVVASIETKEAMPSTVVASGGSYIQIPDPGLAAAQKAANDHQKKVKPAATFDLPFAHESWLDVATIADDNKVEPYALYVLGKPIVVADTGSDFRSDTDVKISVKNSPTASVSPDAARYRLWKMRMAGAYRYGGTTSSMDAVHGLTGTQSKWELACAALFNKTRFWRLVPNQDMLGGPEENPFDRRRRRRAEAAAKLPTKKNEADASRPTGPVYVLADPSWEYVIYLQNGGSVTLDLLEATGTLKQVWFNPRTGMTASETQIQGGSYRAFTAPDNQDWVLYLSRR